MPVYTCHEHQVPLQYTVIHSNMRGYVCFLHPGTTNDKYCMHFTSFNNPNEHWNFIQKKNSLIIYNYLTGWSNNHSTYWFCKVGNLISVEPICSQGLIMMMVMMTTTKKKYIYIYLKFKIKHVFTSKKQNMRLTNCNFFPYLHCQLIHFSNQIRIRKRLKKTNSSQ